MSGMKVRELIAALEKMPADADAFLLSEGCKVDVVNVWEGRGGSVLMADFDEPVYHDEDRPLSAPSVAERKHWKTPRKF